MTVSQIIEKLGGPKAIVTALSLPAAGVGTLRVRAWRHRKSIPAEYWAAIAKFSKDEGRGVSLEDLAAAHSNMFDRSERAA